MSSEFDEVIDPDVDLRDRAQVAELRPRQWDILAAIAVGGVLGSEARYGLAVAIPSAGTRFPWSTLIINASGCALIGALMVILLQLSRPHRLARPFLGVGILGGYTTFSTFAVDVVRLEMAHRAFTALSYVVLTVLTGTAAVWTATTITRRAGRDRIRRLEREGIQ